MAAFSKKTKKGRPNYDTEKERRFKELTLILSGAGVTVRREELKRGNGWRVVSGSCRMAENKMIFVDRRLPQTEQVAFLNAKVLELGLSPELIQTPPSPEIEQTSL